MGEDENAGEGVRHLLTVVDHFLIGGSLGLVVVPDFSVPKEGWKEQRHVVRIVRPDGSVLEADAKFGMAHFNIRDPDAPMDRRWRVMVCFPDETKESIPVGSQIYARGEVVEALGGERCDE